MDLLVGNTTAFIQSAFNNWQFDALAMCACVILPNCQLRIHELLMDFEKSIAQYVNLLDIEGKENVLSYPLLGELFDAAVFNKMVRIQNDMLTEKEYAAGSTNNMTRPAGNPQLLSHDKTKINLLIYYLHQRKSSFMGEMRRLTVQKQLVEKLIGQINKEYNLGDE